MAQRISFGDIEPDEPKGEEGVEFEELVRCIGETDKAICVTPVSGGQKIWIPQSQIHDDSEVWERGQTGRLVVSEWFAKQRGWV